MKFCYLDESGTGDEPYAVMVGIVVDAYRMHVTKNDWQQLLQTLSNIIGRNVQEIHTRDFYAGNTPWRGISGTDRASVINAIFDWLAERHHHIVFSFVDRTIFNEEFQNETISNDIKSLWCFLGLHIILSIQKKYQRESGNKGNTLLIFDNEEREQLNFSELIKNPPEWTDTFYNRNTRHDRLNQIIDVPYFGDSKDVALIQLADFTAYFLRRYVEIQEEAIGPRYNDESERVTNWFNQINSRSIGQSIIYPKRGRCDCADLFFKYAPNCIKNI